MNPKRFALGLRAASFVTMASVGAFCFGAVGCLLFSALWLADSKPGWAWQ